MFQGKINDYNELSFAQDIHKKQKPTLYSLWEKSLYTAGTQKLRIVAENFLDKIVENQPTIKKLVQTELQYVIYKEYEKNDIFKSDGRPFQSNRHVIISSPTSSGKTTVSEMFLVRPPLLNKERRCSIYIAPTRALTQIKFKELKEKFNGSGMKEIVLSTGEDSDDDWRINHNDFSIACIVYEKANILFSTNKKLLDGLGCIVVDELHMLADLERGPILEMVLTKIISKRHQIDDAEDRSSAKEGVRIVTISTEDNPDIAVQKFLTTKHPITTDDCPPLIFHASERPVHVQHFFVLQKTKKGVIDGNSYDLEKIIKFKNTENRNLNNEALRQIEKKLLKRELLPDQLPRYAVSNGMNQCLCNLLLDILNKHKTGHRILVFIPSRNDVEERAKELKNKISKSISRDYHKNLTDLLSSDLENYEDSRMKKTIEECAEFGILFHHSDISRKIRNKIEEIGYSIDEDTPSQILFATETLSYGVNLAVHDVVLFGTLFHTQDRFRIPQLRPLSIHAYHNMTGRAGRLGKLSFSDQSAKVYIIVPADYDPYTIIETYYQGSEALRSTLYATDDRMRQVRFDKRKKINFSNHINNEKEYSELRAVDFSYPLVRSVLDGLRHMNSESRKKNDNQLEAISLEKIFDLFLNSLYSYQYIENDENKREPVLFRCALSRILEDCATSSLELVEIKKGTPDLYRITSRGEAVIDTGTEIQTLDPLLKIVKDFHAVWVSFYPKQRFPAEVYILCILAQDEVFRPYIHYTPECRGSEHRTKNWPASLCDENRTAVFESFILSLQRIIYNAKASEIKEFALSLREILDNWEPIRKLEPRYNNGASDSLLRFFNGMIAWIEGEDRERVNELIESNGLPEGYHSTMQKLIQFTERLNIKILFLSKMLATSKNMDILSSSEDQRILCSLAYRLRFGCTSIAVPFFYSFNSDILRKEARNFIENNLTPSRILAINDIEKLSNLNIGITNYRVKNLINNLSNQVKSKIKELQNEFSCKDDCINDMWKNIVEFFNESIEQYSNEDVSQHHSFNENFLNRIYKDRKQERYMEDELSLLTHKNYEDEERYRIKIIPCEFDGIILKGEKIHEDTSSGDRRSKKKYFDDCEVKISGFRFKKNWEANTGDGEKQWMLLADFIEKNNNVNHLAIIVFPWLPLQDAMPMKLKNILKDRASFFGEKKYTTTFVTPAAFAAMMTLIFRDWINSKLCIRMLTKNDSLSSSYTIIGVDKVHEAIDQSINRQSPPVAIKEKLINYFEVI